MSTKQKQMNLIHHLLSLQFSSWPVDLGLYPDHLKTSAANARAGALMALAGGDSTRARRFLAQGGIEDQLDLVTREFSALVADHAELMESLPDPTEHPLPRVTMTPGRQPGWSPARLARYGHGS